MKKKYYVCDSASGKSYGPFTFYKTAAKIADKIDDTYGEVIAEIKQELKFKKVRVKRYLN